MLGIENGPNGIGKCQKQWEGLIERKFPTIFNIGVPPPLENEDPSHLAGHYDSNNNTAVTIMIQPISFGSQNP